MMPFALFLFLSLFKMYMVSVAAWILLYGMILKKIITVKSYLHIYIQSWQWGWWDDVLCPNWNHFTHNTVASSGKETETKIPDFGDVIFPLVKFGDSTYPSKLPRNRLVLIVLEMPCSCLGLDAAFYFLIPVLFYTTNFFTIGSVLVRFKFTG